MLLTLITSTASFALKKQAIFVQSGKSLQRISENRKVDVVPIYVAHSKKSLPLKFNMQHPPPAAYRNENLKSSDGTLPCLGGLSLSVK